MASQLPTTGTFVEYAPTESASGSMNFSCGSSLCAVPASALRLHHTVLPALSNRKLANPFSLRSVLPDSTADGRMFNIAAKTKIYGVILTWFPCGFKQGTENLLASVI